MMVSTNIVYTCVFVVDERRKRILLGFKKRGLLRHKWNGFGGKVEPGETILEAARRELTEECGLKANTLTERGVLTIDQNGRTREVHLFTTNTYHGQLFESNEMRPEWFNINDMPFEKMCDDLPYWLPKILENQKLNIHFKYVDEECVDYRIEVLSS